MRSIGIILSISLLTSRVAKEAVSIGLINQVVSKDILDDTGISPNLNYQSSGRCIQRPCKWCSPRRTITTRSFMCGKYSSYRDTK